MKNFRHIYALPIAFLLISSCQNGPPKEEGDFKASELVELVLLDPSLKLDIRYATTNNFLNRAVYKEPRAFLQRPAAEAVVRANKELHSIGFGLLVFDGYRPWNVTKVFWDETVDEKRAFVADPSKGSRHNRGCAVDLSLYDLSTGLQVPMPSDYDEMNETAHPSYSGGNEKERQMRDLLIATMETQGFNVYENEWWHFDFQGWEEYRIENIPFSEIHPNPNIKIIDTP